MIGFIGYDEFYSIFLAYRICWLEGRFGGGKTCLSIITAAKLLADGKVERIISNVPCSFALEESQLPKELNDCGIILDESWIYLTDRSAVYRYAAFVRKFNHYLMLPSIWPPHQRMTFLRCMRTFNFYSIGIPAWLYRWQLGMRTVREKGYFIISNPHEIFSHYDNKFVPGTDGGISDAIKRTSENKGFKINRVTIQDEGWEQAVDAIEDGALTVQEAVDSIEGMAKRAKRR